MSNTALIILVITVVITWNFALSILYIKAVRHYKKLKLGNSKTLYDYLENVFRELDKISTFENAFEKRIKRLEDFSTTPLQKFSLLRFNPYGDVGGDQSFTVALLNKEGDGVVLSSLHGRSTTRVYAKPVESGKSHKYELSEEEKEAIKLALK